MIQRKKRLINTLSTTTNTGAIPNSQSYQLNGKQIAASKQQLVQDVSPQLNLKGNMHVSNNQVKKPGKQLVYSSAPHSPKVPVTSQNQGSRDVKATTSQFTTTRTSTNALSSSHNNII